QPRSAKLQTPKSYRVDRVYCGVRPAGCGKLLPCAAPSPHPRRSSCAREAGNPGLWLTGRHGCRKQQGSTGRPDSAGELMTTKAIATLAALAAMLISGMSGAAARAQGTVKAEYGDWQMSCDTPPGASFEQCAIIQNVLAEDQPNVGLSV